MTTTLEAISKLGVKENSLNEEQLSLLDANGFLVLENILNEEEIQLITKRLDELIKEEGENAGNEFLQEEGTIRLSNLVDKDPIFEKVITNPLVLSGISHVLGENFKLSSLNSRFALPGGGQQDLHTDWVKPPVPEGKYKVCNSIWLLDDFTTENGATRVVPGTHKSESKPRHVLEDAGAVHPDQIQLTAKAGTVVVFNSHVWHGGVQNKTDLPRRAMHAYYCHASEEQQQNQKELLSEQTINRLKPETKRILDV